MRGLRVLFLFAAGLAGLVAGCRARPAAGGRCRPGEPLVCAGRDLALVCESGSWAALPCKGARGCAARGSFADCDDTIAAEGDFCPRDPPADYACTPDHAEALVCSGGRFALWRRCRGPESCRVEGERNVHCDTTLGEVGDPCAQAGTYACSSDRALLLSCDGASLKPASSCRGPGGCTVERDSRKVACDDAVAREGDACDQAKRIACSLDGKAELMCSGGKYERKRECRRSACRLDDDELFCD